MPLALFAGWLLVMPAGAVSAADGTTAGEEAGLTTRIGPFDGYDSKEGLVWVDDKVFEVTDKLKVIGTAKKAAVLSEIKQGETVTIIFGEKGRKHIPVAIEIRRQ